MQSQLNDQLDSKKFKWLIRFVGQYIKISLNGTVLLLASGQAAHDIDSNRSVVNLKRIDNNNNSI